MPAKAQIRGLIELRQRLLHFVFAELALTGVGCRANVINRKCFGDGDEANRGRIAPCSAGRARHAVADVSQPGAERGGVEHYFGNCAAIAFAVAAFGPFGASFKYVSNSVPAPLRFPSFTSAMPS